MYFRRKKADTAGYDYQLQVATGNGTLQSLLVFNRSPDLVFLCLFDSAVAVPWGHSAHWAPIPLPAGAYYESDTPRDFHAGLYLCASFGSDPLDTNPNPNLWITAEYVY